jgi:hypothetical protein
MNQATDLAQAPTPAPPGNTISLILFAAAALLLGGLLAYVLLDGPAFNSFPGRTIGISLLSDIDPHYRIGLFLVLSAMLIVISWAGFTLSRWHPGWQRTLPWNSTTALLLACLGANALAAALHSDTSLFIAGSGHCAGILLLWGLGRWRNGSLTSESFVLHLTLAWQASSLLLWLAGRQPDLWYYPLTLLLYLAAGLASDERYCRWYGRAMAGWLLLAPVLLIAAIEWAYFSQGTGVAASDSLLRFGLLSLLTLAGGALLRLSLRNLTWLGALGVLLTTFIINQYDNTVLYKGYDLFHLPEKMLPLHQWENFSSIPFIDYHPGHGVFDMLPHGAYYLLNGGNPLESLVWGNGYFIGWTVQTLYIGLLFAFLARVFESTTAFFLLWLLPVFHVLDPYNSLLLLPLLNLLTLPSSARPQLRWHLQWLLTLALALWRADFGMIVVAGNLITAAALAWHQESWRSLVRCLASMAILSLLLLLGALATAPEIIAERLARSRDLMQIQLLAASYDHFYKEWNQQAWAQYILMPVLGALAGGYALARVYLRQDRQLLGIHLVIIFATAIGFALSIRLFQRHSLVEGVTKTNFFYLAPLLLLATLRYSRPWQGPVAVCLVIATFLLTPKAVKYREESPWSPRQSYPITTHPTEFPELAGPEPRLQDRVEKYDSFIEFSRLYLRPGEAFYDFANAPMLYMLAGLQLPNFVYESVWHTSEKVQHSTLQELEALRSEKRLPFVLFRQNNRWDSLDGVDNALRSYKVAEYIYTHYRPCIRIHRFDIWTDKRRSCAGSLQRLVPADSTALQDTQTLAPDYLVQMIDFGHLPYIWANHDTHTDEVESVINLDTRQLPSGVFDLAGAQRMECRGRGCYLDLRIVATEAGIAEIRLGGSKIATFRLRPGSQLYRLRLSALYRWHQAIGGNKLRLASKTPISVELASLTPLAKPTAGSGQARALAVYCPDCE